MTAYKNENLAELTKPRHFYCTFHHEYAYHKAIEVNKIEQLTFLNEQVAIRDATEPTDIIWENRHIRKEWRRVRWCMAVFLMILLSFCGFTLIFVLLKNKLAV